MHCLHREFIHTLHDGLVNAAATGYARRSVAARNVSVVTATASPLAEERPRRGWSIHGGLGHCGRGGGAAGRQRGRGGTCGGLVNRITGSAGEEEENKR